MSEAAMTIRNIILDGREYVLIPRKQWEMFSGRSAGVREKPLKQEPLLPDGSYTLRHVRISLANKMSTARKAVGLTQAQLAKAAGVRIETISRLENGLHMPGAKTFDKIDRAIKRAEKVCAA
jgi:DNA-binding XRE family transcriptional regulator